MYRSLDGQVRVMRSYAEPSGASLALAVVASRTNPGTSEVWILRRRCADLVALADVPPAWPEQCDGWYARPVPGEDGRTRLNGRSRGIKGGVSVRPGNNDPKMGHHKFVDHDATSPQAISSSLLNT